MAKEKNGKNDFLNVMEFSRSFREEEEPMNPGDRNEWYMRNVLQIQLGMLQQLTMIAQHLGKIVGHAEKE